MAYSEFTLSVLTRQFSLTIDETSDLFVGVPEATLRSEFQARLDIMVVETNRRFELRSRAIPKEVVLIGHSQGDVWLSKSWVEL